MANRILLKRSSTQNGQNGFSPSTGDLSLGELALNTYEGRLFAKKDNGSASVIDLTRNDPIRLLGDATSSYSYDTANFYSNVTVTLAASGVTNGTYGGKTSSAIKDGGSLIVPIITVNSKGLVTSSSNVTLSLSSDFGSIASQDYNSVSITGGSINGTNIGLSTAANGTFANLRITSDLTLQSGATVHGSFISDEFSSTGNASVGNNLTVSGSAYLLGNLYVSGTTTTVNSSTISISDLNLELAKDATNAATANGGGITIRLGTDGDATFNYASTDNSWNLNKKLNALDVVLQGNIAASTGTFQNLTSGRVTFATTNGKLIDDSGLAYNSGTSELTVSGNVSAAKAKFSTLTSGRITFAGTNGLLSDDSGLTYNSSTTLLTLSGNLSAQGITTSGNINAGSGNVIIESSTGNVYLSGGLTASMISVGNLTITGTTVLGAITSSGVSAGQVVYAGSDGRFISEAALAYNDSTNTLTTGNLTVTTAATVGSTLSVTGNLSVGSTMFTVTSLGNIVSNSTTPFTANNYATGAVAFAGDTSIAGKLQVSGVISKGGFELISSADTIDGGSY